MYSLVLMTAMTASAPQAPNCFLCHPLFAMRGCCGGGGCAGSCNGGGGCCGGRYYGGCNGGGCCGGRSYGGCAGCAGSCNGSRSGSYGSGSATMPYTVSADWGAHYTYLYTYPGMRPTNVPSSVGEPLPPPRKEDKTKKPDPSARIIIEVPDGALLYVDGELTQGRAGTRYFYTPPLAKDQKYFYDIRVELTQDGKSVPLVEKKVIVKAGDTVRESFMSAAATNSFAAKSK